MAPKLSSPFAALAGLFLLAVGCVDGDRPVDGSVSINVTQRIVQDDIAADSAIDALVAPFRAELVARTSAVIGNATGEFAKADPEGTLDNLVADAMLWSANAVHNEVIVVAMGNDGGLRAPINEGPITIAEIFELMPFENRVAVLQFSGFQIDSLSQQIARTGGEPVAGLTLTIAGSPAVARDIRIAGQPLDPNALYRVAVADYLANGGGFWPQLWTPLDREDLDLLIRDGIERYIREMGTITPKLDGRIRIEGGGS